jgi:hypothetical protein
MDAGNLYLTIFFLFLMSAGVQGKGTNLADRKMTQAKNSCETTKCAHLYQMENLNCVNECVSSECYKQVYADSPLEDGEINTLLERQFKSCHRKEITSAKRNRNREAEKKKAQDR